MANGKICIECYRIIPNASLQCYYCGAMQLNFYRKCEDADVRHETNSKTTGQDRAKR